MHFRWDKGDRIIGLPGTLRAGERATIECRVTAGHFIGYSVTYDGQAPLTEFIYIYDEKNYTDELPKGRSNLLIGNGTPVAFEECGTKGSVATVGDSTCDHIWQAYHGFVESYEYCEKCDLKK
jgi:hypothetical protein